LGRPLTTLDLFIIFLVSFQTFASSKNPTKSC